MKETFVLIHSAWLGAWQWQEVKANLENEGHEVITPDLAGHGTDLRDPGTITMEDYITDIIEVLDGCDKPVILVGHSFNGITISRVAELRPGKIKSLVYLTAFMVPNGASFLSTVESVEGSVAVENFYLSPDKTKALVNAHEMHNAFAHDIPLETFQEASKFIVPEPVSPLTYELHVTPENWGAIPKYYIECTEDRAIPIQAQRAMYADKVEKVFSLEASHTPNFSNPLQLTEVLLRLIG